MRIILLTLIQLLVFTVNGQTVRGTVVENSSGNPKPGKKYAIIIGINKYRNLPGLTCAANDAQSIYQVLTSPAFNINNKDIVLLIDSSANRSNIYEVMYNVEEKLKENDILYFFFAGHGDIESKIFTTNSLLLLPEAPNKNYLRSAEFLDMNTLKEYFSNLSAKKVKSIFICDACHSGNLIGGMEGQRITSTNLQQNWTNEIKILSSQPNELSLENKKLGVGRGVFSYFLESALKGMADDGDGILTLGEIKRFIEKEVAYSTTNRQNPLVFGDPKTVICKVNKNALVHVKNINNSSAINDSSINFRGLRNVENENLAKLKLLIEYNTCSEKNEIGAISYARILIEKNLVSIDKIEKGIYESCNKRFQKIIEKYYNNVPLYPDLIEMQDLNMCIELAMNIIQNTFFVKELSINSKFLRIESELIQSNRYEKQRSIELLNIVNAMIEVSPSKAYLYKKAAELSVGGGMYTDALNKLKVFLSILPNDPHTYNFGGMILIKMKEYQEAVNCLERAIQIRPRFFEAYYNLGVAYNAMGQKDKASQYFKMAERIKQ